MIQIEDCWFTGNYSNSIGGAIFSKGTINILRSSFSDNSGSGGGAVGFSQTGGFAANSTFFRNTSRSGAEGGGAILSSTSVDITHCTFTENVRLDGVSAPNPGGAIGVAFGTIEVRGCIFDRNSGSTQFNAISGGSIISDGYNLITSGNEGILTDGSDIANSPADLRPFDFHLGLTPTAPPAEGSATVNVIPDPSPFPSPPTTDQRRFPRLQGTHHDIGAVEAFPIVTIGATYVGLQDALNTAGNEVRIKFSAASSGATLTMPSDTEILVNNGTAIIDASHLAEPVTILGDASYRLMWIEGVQAQLRKLVFTSGNATQTLTGLPAYGGALFIGEDSEEFVSIVDCQFSDNATSGPGGAISIAGANAMEIRRCTFIDNRGNEGAAIGSAGSTVTIINSTFSGQRATDTGIGETIDSSGPMSISHSTIADSYVAGESFSYTIQTTDSFYFSHCLWQNNENPAINSTDPHTGGFNLSDDSPADFGADDIVNTNVNLGPLGDFGGCVLTRLPAQNSAAIDSGRVGDHPCPMSDARGYNRIRGGRIDIGAVEAHSDYLCDFDIWALERLPLDDRNFTSDTDYDGLDALTEWALGLNPVLPDSPTLSIEPSRMVHFRRNPSAKDLKLTVEISTGLGGWSDLYVVEDGVVTTGGAADTVVELTKMIQIVTLNASSTSSTKRFVRFKIDP